MSKSLKSLIADIMKKIFLSFATLVLASFFGVAHGETVRILSTNDMHSAIEKMPQLAAIVTVCAPLIRSCLSCRQETTARAILTMTSMSPRPIP